MKVCLTNRRCKCSGKINCENLIFCNIKFNKYSVYLCQNCLTELYDKLGKMIIPKSVKSKFYIENNK